MGLPLKSVWVDSDVTNWAGTIGAAAEENFTFFFSEALLEEESVDRIMGCGWI